MPVSVSVSGSDQRAAVCVGGSRERERDATRDPSFRVPPYEHATALAHAARDPRAGLSRGRSDPLVAAVRLRCE